MTGDGSEEGVASREGAAASGEAGSGAGGAGEGELPTVRVVVDFEPGRHLLFNVNDEQVRTLLDRVREERASAGDARAHRLEFEFSAGQIEQTNEAFRRMGETDAADAALVDLTATEDGAAPPTMTLTLSMAEATADELAAGFSEYVHRDEGGDWFVEIPDVSMQLLERALEVALDGAQEPTDTAMQQLRDER